YVRRADAAALVHCRHRLVYCLDCFVLHVPFFLLFFFTATATTEIYTLSLHDALPILPDQHQAPDQVQRPQPQEPGLEQRPDQQRSEEHTSELQSPYDLVCRLLLEKKKNTHNNQLHVCHNCTSIVHE